MRRLLRRDREAPRAPLGIYRYPVLDDRRQPVWPRRWRWGWTCRHCDDFGWVAIVGSARDAFAEAQLAGSDHLVARHPEWKRATQLRMLVREAVTTGSNAPILASDVPHVSELGRLQRAADRARRRDRRATAGRWWWTSA